MTNEFTPNKQRGLILLVILLAVLFGMMLFLLVSGSQVPQDSGSSLRIALGFGMLVPIIYLLNRLYELATLEYELSRSALTFRWGLRQETIPMDMVEWVRLASEFNQRLPLPVTALPGCLIGHRIVNGLGPTRYLAAEARSLVIIALKDRAIVVSPKDAAAFVRQYDRLYELGSLEKVPHQVTDIGALWRKIKADKTARGLILLGGLTTVLLWGGVLVIERTYPQITWVTLEVVPSSRLILLAILGSLTWAIDLILGVLLYLLQIINRVMVYCLWGTALLSGFLFILAALLMSL